MSVHVECIYLKHVSSAGDASVKVYLALLADGPADVGQYLDGGRGGVQLAGAVVGDPDTYAADKVDKIAMNVGKHVESYEDIKCGDNIVFTRVQLDKCACMQVTRDTNNSSGVLTINALSDRLEGIVYGHHTLHNNLHVRNSAEPLNV